MYKQLQPPKHNALLQEIEEMAYTICKDQFQIYIIPWWKIYHKDKDGQSHEANVTIFLITMC